MILEKIDCTFNPEMNCFSRMDYVFSVPKDNTQEDSVKSAFNKLEKILEETICNPNSFFSNIFGNGVKKENVSEFASDGKTFGYLYKRSFETPGGLNRGKFSIYLRYKTNIDGSSKSEITLNHLVEKSSGPEYKYIKKLYNRIISCQDIIIGSEAQKVIEQINSTLHD